MHSLYFVFCIPYHSKWVVGTGSKCLFPIAQQSLPSCLPTPTPFDDDIWCKIGNNSGGGDCSLVTDWLTNYSHDSVDDRHYLTHFWKLRTTIPTIKFDPSIKSDRGQHLQSLQRFKHFLLLQIWKRRLRCEICGQFQTNCLRRVQILYATVDWGKKQVIEWKRVFGKQLFYSTETLNTSSTFWDCSIRWHLKKGPFTDWLTKKLKTKYQSFLLGLTVSSSLFSEI